MWALIVDFLTAFLRAIPVVSKYVPPKTEEQKVEDGEAQVQQEIDKISNEGRP